ncbi:hypothetical protein MRB53_005020 [Persea americana]|uniref:Uncharacterized protein n=1 Tax=Persea americana TaxID=3435 RepID=A0ACC2MBV8_PERAE|nr:hypothetical protein MRB53_005020 [Persea americana]
MGRAPCCDKANVKRGPWSPEEDMALKKYVERHGTVENWIALPHKAGLNRCGKSCRLRWLNYLRPDIKHGGFTEEEDHIIYNLYKSMGSRWSVIASHLPGRTDNDVKNYWNTKLKKKFIATQTNLTTNANNISNHENLSSSPSHVTKNESSASFPSMDPGFGHNLLESQRLFTDPISFSLPAFEESSNFSVSQSTYDAPSSSVSMDNSYNTWPGSEGGEIDGFFMDLGYGFPYDLLNGNDFQKVEVASGLADFSYGNMVSSSETRAQGQFQSVTY